MVSSFLLGGVALHHLFCWVLLGSLLPLGWCCCFSSSFWWCCLPSPPLACWRGGECPYLQRRRCLFGHSAEEVAAALLVGREAAHDDVLQLAEEVQELRRVVQRLAGVVMWGRASLTATSVAKPVVQARPPEIAKDSGLTESVFAMSPGEAGPPGRWHDQHSRSGSSGRVCC